MFRSNLQKLSNSNGLVSKIKLFNKLSKLNDNELKEYIDSIIMNQDLSYAIIDRLSLKNLSSKELEKQLEKNKKSLSKVILKNVKVLNSVFRIRKLFTKDKKMKEEYSTCVNNPFDFMEEKKEDLAEVIFKSENFKETNEYKEFKENEEKFTKLSIIASSIIASNPGNAKETVSDVLEQAKKFIGRTDRYLFFNIFIDELYNRVGNEYYLNFIIIELSKQLLS